MASFNVSILFKTPPKILNRIRRIQGQTNALEQNILNSENSCIEVLQQVAAIKGAINGLMNELIELHLREHVLGDTEEIKEKELNEFLALVKHYL
ncbi:metal/formaldehyde-sensitive transcriptional repressor [Acinetobacter schindleri]|uniref:metal/formaldehyde-sensitive transcriptional repressor n=1 Tax=Acinetobacter schindleri TaxID=108981 RepID=UPI0032B33B02